MARVALVCGFGILGAFGVGLWEDLGDPPRWQEWSFVGLALIWTFDAAIVFRRAVGSPFWVAIALPVVLYAGVLGDFCPYLFGYEGRELRDYTYETPWAVWLVMAAILFGFVGGIAGTGVAALGSLGDLRRQRQGLADNLDAFTLDNFTDGPHR